MKQTLKHIIRKILILLFRINADKILLWLVKHTTSCGRVLVMHGFGDQGLDWKQWHSIRDYFFENFPDKIKFTYDDGRVTNMACECNNPPCSILFINTANIGKPGYLDSWEIKALSRNNIIGSHCHTHPDLTKSNEVEYELYQSQRILKEITGKPCRHFAFPYGAYNQETINIAGKYYDYLYIVKEHTKVTCKKQIIPRVCISNTTTYESNIIRILLSFWYPNI